MKKRRKQHSPEPGTTGTPTLLHHGSVQFSTIARMPTFSVAGRSRRGRLHTVELASGHGECVPSPQNDHDWCRSESSGASMVVLQHATEPFATLDLARHHLRDYSARVLARCRACC